MAALQEWVLLKGKKKIPLTIDRRTTPFPRDWEGNRIGYRVTAGPYTTNHNNTNSPAVSIPRYGKAIDQMPDDVGTGADSIYSVVFDQTVKIVARWTNSILFEYLSNGKVITGFRLHVDGLHTVGTTVKAGIPVYKLRKGDAHVHMAHWKDGKPVMNETVIKWILNPIKEPVTPVPPVVTPPPVVDPCKLYKDQITVLETEKATLSQKLTVAEQKVSQIKQILEQ